MKINEHFFFRHSCLRTMVRPDHQQTYPSFLLDSNRQNIIILTKLQKLQFLRFWIQNYSIFKAS